MTLRRITMERPHLAGHDAPRLAALLAWRPFGRRTRARAKRPGSLAVLLWRLVALALAIEVFGLVVSFVSNAWTCGLDAGTACSAVARLDFRMTEVVVPGLLAGLLGLAIACEWLDSHERRRESSPLAPPSERVVRAPDGR